MSSSPWPRWPSSLRAAADRPDRRKVQSSTWLRFSVPKAAYDDTQQAFADTPEGEGTSWKSSYGASGDQARAVMSGLPADYVSFSLNSDMTKLVDKQLVAPDWASGANKGIVSTSVVVIVTRKGNPLGITGWDDLTKPESRS